MRTSGKKKKTALPWKNPDFLTGSGTAETQATQIIRRCGVSARLRGYEFLRLCILLAVEKRDRIGSITTELYPTVAKQYGTTSQCVERAIRTALDDAWKYGDPEAIRSFCRMNGRELDRRPTNGEFIAFAADTIQLSAKQ